jgi:hypothetical protein
MIARDTQIREAYIQGLESMFRRESSDPKWAASAISAIQAALGADKVGLSSRNTECRAQTCRLEIPDDGSGKVNAALPVLASQLATVLPYVDADQVDDGAGGKTVVLYLANSRPNLPPGP